MHPSRFGNRRAESRDAATNVSTLITQASRDDKIELDKAAMRRSRVRQRFQL